MSESDQASAAPNAGPRIKAKSNVQPPAEQAGPELNAISDAVSAADPLEAIKNVAFARPSLAAIVTSIRSGKGPKQVSFPADKPSQPTPAQEIEIAKLATAKAVNVMLAAADFWAATRVEGGTYAAGIGVGPLTLSLVTQVGGATQVRSHVVSALSQRELDEAIAGVKPGDTTQDFVQRLLAASEVPQYLFALALGLDDVKKKPYTCMIFDIVPAVVAVATQRLKHLARVPRPSEVNTQLTTTIDNPAFTSYPGGHAAIAYAMAKVLSAATGANASELAALAQQIARDRVSAAIHTDIDTSRGQAVGEAMAQWMLEAVNQPQSFGPWSGVFAQAMSEWQPPSAP